MLKLDCLNVYYDDFIVHLIAMMYYYYVFRSYLIDILFKTRIIIIGPVYKK